MTSSPDFDLLPPDPLRGLDETDVANAEGDFDGITYAYGMHTAVGAARVAAAVGVVRQVLSAGLGRDAALLTLLGACSRLERDGHREYSDTVVRESIRTDLALDCVAAGVEPFTDDEVGEVALSLSLRSLDTYARGFAKGVAADLPSE